MNFARISRYISGLIVILAVLLPCLLTYISVKRAVSNRGLIMALKEDNSTLAMSLIIDKGADVNSYDDPTAPTTAWGVLKDKLLKGHSTKPHGKTALLLLLEYRENADGQSFVLNEHPVLLRTLLEHGAKVDDRDRDGNTPLMLACQQGKHQSAVELLNYGASINLTNNNGLNPLMLASEKDDAQMVQTLLNKGANVNGVTPEKLTPLMFAAKGGHSEISPRSYGHPETTELLLRAGANVDARDQLNQTALMYAVGSNRPDIVRVLLHYGGNPNATDGSRSVLRHGIGRADIVKLLKQAGAK